MHQMGPRTISLGREKYKQTKKKLFEQLTLVKNIGAVVKLSRINSGELKNVCPNNKRESHVET